jgi:hypothetical protein
MKSFRVWVRSLGGASRLRVEGSENTEWLIGRLSQSFVYKSSEPVSEDEEHACCTFQVPYCSLISRSGLERLLGTIPEVKVMLEPA